MPKVPLLLSSILRYLYATINTKSIYKHTYPISFLPHLICPVHVDCCFPVLTLNVVVLSLLESSINF